MNSEPFEFTKVAVPRSFDETEIERGDENNKHKRNILKK